MVVTFVYTNEEEAQHIIETIKEYGFSGTIEKNTPYKEVQADIKISEAELTRLKNIYTIK